VKLFLDTAHLSDILTTHEWGILDGVTTKPSLTAQGYDTQALATGLRPPVHVVEAVRRGADSGTVVPTPSYRHWDGALQRRPGERPALPGRQAGLSPAERIV
jgi:hypothetical protein